MKRRKPLKRGTIALKRTPIQRVSSKQRKKRQEAHDQFHELVRQRGYVCEVGQRIKTVVPEWAHCTHWPEGRHHLRKRSAGGSDDPSNLLLSCNPCNGWVEDHPALAREAGLVIRDGDD